MMEITLYNNVVDIARDEGKCQGIVVAIDALRNKEFQKMFDLDDLEAEICAEALFTHINQLLK